MAFWDACQMQTELLHMQYARVPLSSGKGDTGMGWFHVSGGLACLFFSPGVHQMLCLVEIRGDNLWLSQQAAASQGPSAGGSFSAALNMQGRPLCSKAFGSLSAGITKGGFLLSTYDSG